MVRWVFTWFQRKQEESIDCLIHHYEQECFNRTNNLFEMNACISRTLIIMIAVLCAMFLFNCEPDEPIMDIVHVETLPVESFTDTTAVLIGRVIHPVEGIKECGHYLWENVPEATLLKTLSVGLESDSFISYVSGLKPYTSYCIKAFATNGAQTSFGEIVEFTTLAELPTVITEEVTDITSTSAQSGGNVISDGGSVILAKGVCWSENQNPTIEDQVTNEGTEAGSFVSHTSGLSPNTTYYLRAYATNSRGTAYGDQICFTTSSASLPTIKTATVTNITSFSAQSGGYVTNDGGANVTDRGVCWNTTGNPTTSNSLTNNGTGTGGFSSDLTDLSPNTTYYVRAYATNSQGTVYGSQVSFTTDSLKVNEFMDARDGQIYKWIKIGDQVWMAENLRYLPGVSPPTVGSDTDMYYYVYDYSGTSIAQAKASINYTTYGVLYNWPAAMNGESSSDTNPSGVQGICPSGWHIPSWKEFEVLIDFLGGSSVAGGKLKEVGTEHWIAPNIGANNESGFSGLPGGVMNTDAPISIPEPEFSGMGEFGCYWSSTSARYVILEYKQESVGWSEYLLSFGWSVRCTKD